MDNKNEMKAIRVAEAVCIGLLSGVTAYFILTDPWPFGVVLAVVLVAVWPRAKQKEQ